MSDRVYVGREAASVKKNNAYEPVDRVLLWTGDDSFVRSPNVSDSEWESMTGYILEADCPYATQALADARLAELQGMVFTPYQATNAFVDPAADLGDAVTVGGVYSIIGSQKIFFDSLCVSDISAGTVSDEVSDGVYKPYTEKRAARALSAANKALAQLTVTNERIEGIVSDVDGMQSTITQLSNSISLVVTNGEVNAASIVAAINDDGSSSVVISADKLDLSGVATFSAITDAIDDLEDDMSRGNTVINGGCITTGTIDAQYISTDIADVASQIYLGGSGSTDFGQVVFNTGGNISVSNAGLMFLTATRFWGTFPGDVILASTGGDTEVQGDSITLRCTSDAIYLENSSGSYWKFDGRGIHFYNTSGVNTKDVVLEPLSS